MRKSITKYLAAVLAVACCLSCSKADKPAKYIFLFIGDGMGHENVSVAESYLSYKDGLIGGTQLCFTQFPYLGMADTYSANDRITDSSAGGTAIACGVKTNNGMLGVDPDGNPVYSFALDLQDRGYNIGIMSTVQVNHATPGAFYGHTKSRYDYYGITQEIPVAGYKFYGGQNFLNFNGNEGNDNSEEMLNEAGYDVCFGEDEFNNAKKGKRSKMVYIAEPRGTITQQYESRDLKSQTVSEVSMFKSCMEYLGDKKPFFIMCEGGEIDWEAHSNNTMPMITAIQNMDEAVKVAYEFYLKHPDETLIVVTADHETGGVAIGNGHSPLWEVYDDAVGGGKTYPAGADNKALNAKGGIGWTTTGHAGSPVPVYAIGKGAEKFCGRFDNTDISKKILCKE